MKSKPITEDELRQNPLFAGLNPDQLSQMIAAADIRRLTEEEHLFNFGDHASRFFMVRSGQIKLYRLSPMG
ncbi:MAG: cyclic nucleotide-binding domain-containing protein, partial [Gammaproteobacteria bacterium]|nr:cyclic nucleotide-binding domain-containing protein [Gammaproteobacteria bacterium]